ncbi:dihydrodipicolinate synthase family protein [Limnochorda pilosa]|uniref:Dihydrodipicolinate synthetase n=1 Tax=Limnochorda pilosa TaxID=1555112 RepID=A0A0K2SN40_LIMPI|nr:dihydrodipicolinate synthase family protein [Limnochorda pilosa]BAS28229.1 dihydrodipicolinate synthetase [Limnochorda pilosa]
MSDLKNPARWSGVFPATLLPFNDDYSIDEEEFTRYLQWLVSHEGISGVVVNGHTGEITSLNNAERARVIELAVEAVGDKVPVVSGVLAEGTLDAIDQAKAAKRAGASGILLMPPHHWLRFGKGKGMAQRFFADVGEASGLAIIVHQYPAWSKAGYSLEELLDMAAQPHVVAIKMGTREMARYNHDFRVLKQRHPDVTILTCHDEYLLPTLVEGADGALIGFAGFVPDLMVALVAAVRDMDLRRAKTVQDEIYPLGRLVYRFGEPSGNAHQRMKYAMYLLGRLRSPLMRPPLVPLSDEDIARIRQDLAESGLRGQLRVV